jgi:hypothetical protein
LSARIWPLMRSFGAVTNNRLRPVIGIGFTLERPNLSCHQATSVLPAPRGLIAPRLLL